MLHPRWKSEDEFIAWCRSHDHARVFLVSGEEHKVAAETLQEAWAFLCSEACTNALRALYDHERALSIAVVAGGERPPRHFGREGELPNFLRMRA